MSDLKTVAAFVEGGEMSDLRSVAALVESGKIIRPQRGRLQLIDCGEMSDLSEVGYSTSLRLGVMNIN